MNLIDMATRIEGRLPMPDMPADDFDAPVAFAVEPGCMTDAEAICTFCTAGKAKLTLKSTKTGTRFTFSVKAIKDTDDRWFVGLLTGSDNERDYSYVGVLSVSLDGFYEFRLTAKSRMTAEAPAVKAFMFFTRNVLNRRTLPEALAVFHEGKCGRCNRTLTVPESIASGIGPECARRM